MYYQCSENKGADQLRSSAPLFSPMQIVGFPMRWFKCLCFSAWNIYVEDIMVREVKCISFVSTYKELKELLADTNYRTYPLVDSTGNCLFVCIQA